MFLTSDQVGKGCTTLPNGLGFGEARNPKTSRLVVFWREGEAFCVRTGCELLDIFLNASPLPGKYQSTQSTNT